ncbi:cytochrome b/b6 domain-containing protein [Phormidium sp. CLA17]|nr:cytochrome b/b6 domain-containing protein [Leptolyngbya sp. Cla-17]
MLLHWVMAAFVLSLYITGVFVARPLQAHFLVQLIPFLHQSFGILFLMLLIARIFLLLRVVSSKYLRRLPKITPAWLQTTILHSSLYFFMLVAPVSGFLLRNFVGVNTTFFGIHIPPVFALNQNWIELTRSSHFWSSYIFLAFILLHVLTHWRLIWKHAKKVFSSFQRLLQGLPFIHL